MNIGASHRIIKMCHLGHKKGPGNSREHALLVLFDSLTTGGAGWTAMKKINTALNKGLV